MFDNVFDEIVAPCSGLEERAEGVAFFRAAKSLYSGISRISYLGINIPVESRRNHFLHCVYSDCRVKQVILPRPVEMHRLQRLSPAHARHAPNSGDGAEPRASAELFVSLRSLRGEFAVFGVEGEARDALAKAALPREMHILANYFHQHVMRIYGHDAAHDMIMSARELDCLKWVAEGKTAWEVSVILGISERTVRFHLNSVREKMRCTTTTQAVAKAVAQRLIPI